MSRSPLNALVVGTGFGCRIHVPALRAAGFNVAGVVGTDAERTARRAQQVAVEGSFTDLGAAILKTGAKVVTIATPPHTHAALTLSAISQGCHVICEKPFTMNAAEAKQLLAAAEAAKVVHLTGHEFRWAPDRALIGRAVAEGHIGTPRFATLIQYNSIAASPEAKLPRWWFDSKAGGGWLGASGSHIIDYVRIALGEFESVSAGLPTVSDRPPGAEDTYSVRFRLTNGVEGMLQQTAGAWGSYASFTRIAGTKGTLWTQGQSVHLADREGERELPQPEDLKLPPPPPPTDDARHRYSALELGPYTRLCEALLRRIEGDSTPASVAVPTFVDGLACMKVMDAIRESAAQGGALVRVA